MGHYFLDTQHYTYLEMLARQVEYWVKQYLHICKKKMFLLTKIMLFDASTVQKMHPTEFNEAKYLKQAKKIEKKEVIRPKK